MSALALPPELDDPQLLDDLIGRIDVAQSCRFCQCTETSPCPILIAENPDGSERLARTENEAGEIIFCSWYLRGVCSAPVCIEKLLEEKRGKVLLFDAQGRQVPSAERVG